MADAAIRDIKIDHDTLRLPLVNGDYELVQETELIKQHIVTALRTFINDWILDYTKGIDYALGFKNQVILESDIKTAILEVIGVSQLNNFILRKVGREFTITANVIINNEEVLINETMTL